MWRFVIIVLCVVYKMVTAVRAVMINEQSSALAYVAGVMCLSVYAPMSHNLYVRTVRRTLGGHRTYPPIMWPVDELHC